MSPRDNFQVLTQPELRLLLFWKPRYDVMMEVTTAGTAGLYSVPATRSTFHPLLLHANPVRNVLLTFPPYGRGD